MNENVQRLTMCARIEAVLENMHQEMDWLGKQKCSSLCPTMDEDILYFLNNSLCRLTDDVKKEVWNLMTELGAEDKED